LMTSEQLSRDSNGMAGGASAGGAMQISKSLTINRPAGELYQFWRDFRNLPRFKSMVESVAVTGNSRSHWRVKGPAGAMVEWDAEIIDDRPDELIAWRSAEGSPVEINGVVTFRPAPGGKGTEVRDELRLIPPGGGVVTKIAGFFGKALEQQVLEDLRRFKQLMEVGEIPVSEASIQRERPAQPPPDELVARR